MKKITIFLSVLLSVFMLTGCGGTKKEVKESLDWPDNELTKLIPKPDAKYGETNSIESTFIAKIKQQSAEDYKKYVQECEKKGFKIDKTEDVTSSFKTYEAYDKSGNHLTIQYDKDDKEYDINLEKTKVADKYVWPTMGMATLIPKPDSDYGTITSDNKNYFTIYVGKTSKEDLAKYVNKVAEKGFTIDYSKSDNGYSAKDSKGNMINIHYEGFNTMKIHLSFSEDEDTSEEETTTLSSSQPEQTQPSQQPTQQTSTTGVRPEVKEQIDAYEKFFDEYIAFMTKYKDSNNAVSMAADYANFMKKYTDYMAKFENIDDKGWNDAEVAYWLEVNGRVMGKLATIQ
ncbi:DUF6591 domain-containing protein [Enterococcus cecorum]|uniref:DUF6591 domain-containing protein n=1 Tax=Enterococcus cecorum TaxID=44008 RepID=UPI001FAD1BD2|nr:DUF6591 domain-containing protein [Enterococcus cecorum]MCJ0536677.1 hypothetical protein [Enterococcus cecorum]MCJ0547163.1 hypothetical protein [Enterococcus cecorum]MCJ0551660.1 hypothetical protein [Enterococcus cecorum]MCJ0570311.1 hypothetical protein [Enterococcus cecorum]